MAETMEPEAEGLQIELDAETGVMRLLGEHVPPVTCWTQDLIDLISRGGSLWCSIDRRLGFAIIQLVIKPETLWYALTGEVDEWGALIATRCNQDGTEWTDDHHE